MFFKKCQIVAINSLHTGSNPLDYTFWGQAMAKVWEAKPSTIPELKAVVEAYFASLDADFIKKCVLNIKKRA